MSIEPRATNRLVTQHPGRSTSDAISHLRPSSSPRTPIRGFGRFAAVLRGGHTRIGGRGDVWGPATPCHRAEMCESGSLSWRRGSFGVGRGHFERPDRSAYTASVYVLHIVSLTPFCSTPFHSSRCPARWDPNSRAITGGRGRASARFARLIARPRESRRMVHLSCRLTGSRFAPAQGARRSGAARTPLHFSGPISGCTLQSQVY